MKKTYINPETIVVKLQPVLMQAASPMYGGRTTATSGNLSRRGDFWDDEEVDE